MVLGIVIRQPQLLVMAVAGDQQVKAHVGKTFVETLFVATREMCYGNLPSSLALGQQPCDPFLLFRPQRSKPAWASINRGGSICSCTCGRRFVVLSAAHVVVGIFLWCFGIHKVGVQEIIVDIKAQVCIDNSGAVVGCWHYPAIGSPGVRHLLIPTVVELEASPVMIAQDTKPGLATETGTLVNTLKDLIKLMLRRVRDLVHGLPTGLLNPAPVEIITNVEDI
mmetsp:Transcript_109421/g.153107  ORF Transcript_109421/g.153107 Transcript_109421/m.153107 type:complete len:223 (-) Transcript_109421:361-1029(-)